MSREKKTFAIASIATVAALALTVGGAPSMATADTINYTIDCAHDLSVTADVGDTLVFTMTHPGCNGVAEPTGNFANFNNLNGTYFNGIGSGYEGTATSSGFLDYVNHTEGTVTNTDYWFNHGGADDWYVMQTESTSSTNSVVITTTLRDHDGANNPLVVGSIIGDIFTQGAGGVVEYTIAYAGPRTETDADSQSASSDSTADLADTGSNTSVLGLGALALAALGVAAGILARSLKRREAQR